MLADNVHPLHELAHRYRCAHTLSGPLTMRVVAPNVPEDRDTLCQTTCLEGRSTLRHHSLCGPLRSQDRERDSILAGYDAPGQRTDESLRPAHGVGARGHFDDVALACGVHHSMDESVVALIAIPGRVSGARRVGPSIGSGHRAVHFCSSVRWRGTVDSVE